MKLFAFRDRTEDRDKNLGRHHALDLYAIVAGAGRIRVPGVAHVETAREIIRSDFAEPTSVGVMRPREHSLFRPELPIPDFLAVLSEIFPAQELIGGEGKEAIGRHGGRRDTGTRQAET